MENLYIPAFRKIKQRKKSNVHIDLNAGLIAKEIICGIDRQADKSGRIITQNRTVRRAKELGFCGYSLFC